VSRTAGSPPPAVLAARGLDKAFRVNGRLTPALRDIRLEARAGEFLTLIGPSGCGKGTLLAILSGLLRPDSGEVLLHGRPVADLL
jgi:NitT/TauT family transport system ATP-binding protein